jgi:hypothetical protein
VLGHRGDVAGGFDEWAAARTPSLLRFAHALTEDGPAAEAAVVKALARARKDWVAVDRAGDPDLTARRFVVDATPHRRRAAAVLRVLEDRSDEEIAEVLGTSQAFARSQVQRGIATLAQDLPTDRGGALLERLDRDGASAPTHLTRPLAPAEAPSRRRSRSAWVAAAAVLGLVVTVALVARATRTPAGVITYPSVHVPTDWRYESYAGVQVRVPATWGFGGAPIPADFFHGHLAGCGTDRAAVLSSADSAQYVASFTPFVGRPSMMTYACGTRHSDNFMPSADAVWLGSPLAVGVKDVGSVTAETRAIGGQHVTVFSRESALRREILGTAEVVGVDDANGCPTQAVQQPSAGPARLTPSSLSVCVYSQDTGSSVLMWSGRADASSAQAYADAVHRAGSTGPACTGTPSGRWVALGLHAGNGTRWDVVDLHCAAITLAHGTVSLTPATVRDWAREGVTAYAIAGPSVPSFVTAYFHVPMG